MIMIIILKMMIMMTLIMMMLIMIMMIMMMITRVIFNVICSREGGEVISRSSLRSRLYLVKCDNDDDKLWQWWWSLGREKSSLSSSSSWTSSSWSSSPGTSMRTSPVCPGTPLTKLQLKDSDPWLRWEQWLRRWWWRRQRWWWWWWWWWCLMMFLKMFFAERRLRAGLQQLQAPLFKLSPGSHNLWTRV